MNRGEISIFYDFLCVVLANAKTFKIVLIVAKLTMGSITENIFHPVRLKVFYAVIPPTHTYTHTLPLHCRFFCTKIDQSAKNHSSLSETTLQRMYPCEEKNVIHYHTFESNLLKNWGEGRWLGVVLADS